MSLIRKDPWDLARIKWLDMFMVGHAGFIAGGCFKNIFSGEKVKDVDMFFENAIEYGKAIEYYDSLCGENNSGGEYRFHYESNKVKAYKHVKTGVTIELVNSVFGSPEQVIGNFDFTITKFAYFKEEVEDETVFDESSKPGTHIEYRVICHDSYFEHLHLKRIVIDDKVLFPASTFERMFKYAKYGYAPCRGTKVRIIQELRSAIILDDISASLYEGVD